MNSATINLKDVLFIDIETASMASSYASLTSDLQRLWMQKSRYIHERSKDSDQDLDESFASKYFEEKSAIYAEFGKVVCISMGFLNKNADNRRLRIKSIYGDDEAKILLDFSKLLASHFNDPYSHYLCGHNIREFDIPFLCRRYLVNNITLPNLLQVSGLRPWQVNYLIDTLNMWKFGDYKHYCSLDLLCHVLSIPAPKSDMSGSDVSQAYFHGKIEEIRHYCERDVVATARLFMRLSSLGTIDDEDVLFL